MLVASGVEVAWATAAMPPTPSVGSSRYCRTPFSSRATCRDVSKLHAALGSSRRGAPGTPSAAP